jgi:ubiquinone/menaquinone biosynthesis C-methylase UbiE
METDRQAHWRHPGTAWHYARAAVQVGLWASERRLIEEAWGKESRLLELGCGAGRVGLGLLKLGYSELRVTDFSPTMVDMAKGVLADAHEAWADRVEVADACSLPYADASFDGVIFAFNGLMCMRGQADRARALPEIRRVLQPGGLFLFTANDRAAGEHRELWAQEPTLPGCQPGDRWHETDSIPVFMHSSTEAETRAELTQAGFRVLKCPLRSEVTAENAAVRAFAGETRFYLAERV